MKETHIQPQSLLVHLSVWGATFVERARLYAFASMLAPNNFPRVAADREIWLDIRTTREDLDALNELSVVEQLRRYATVSISVFANSAKDCSYTSFTDQQVEAMRWASQEALMYVYHQPDVILADGSLASLVNQLREKRAVVVWGSRCQEEGLAIQLDQFRHGNSLVLSPRELVALQLNNLHSEFQGYEATETTTPSYPSNILWLNKGANQALIRSHSRAPAGINFKNIDRKEADRYFEMLTNSTIDHTHTQSGILGDMSDIHIINDSDDFFWTSPTDSQRFGKLVPSQSVSSEKLSLDASLIRYFETSKPNAYARFFYTQPVTLRTSDDDEWLKSKALETEKLFLRLALLYPRQSKITSSSLLRNETMFLGSYRLAVKGFVWMFLGPYRLAVRTRLGRAAAGKLREGDSRGYNAINGILGWLTRLR